MTVSCSATLSCKAPPRNGTFYEFYLVLQNGTWFADSFGVATSVDGTHFTDHGVVFSGRCLG